MENMVINSNFWKNKKVLITGHTGFKGSWLSLWLQKLGARVTGYALPPSTNPNLFTLANVAKGMNSILSDICNIEALIKVIEENQPEIVLHLAAQPLVRLSYQKPYETYATNIMGTVNLLEAIRIQKSVRVVVVVTSDKCYENREWLWSYRENEAMGGRDPYSSSKGCVELIAASYRNSFFKANKILLATARAGNVIGGGDWSEDRLIPDILRSIETKSKLIIRNPLFTRPWQHVLDCLSGYILLTEKLWINGNEFASAWNFGPSSNDIHSVKSILEQLSYHYGSNLSWEYIKEESQHEASLLALDSSKANSLLNWKPLWNLEKTLIEIVAWHKAWLQGKNMHDFSLQQIYSYDSISNAGNKN